MKPILEICELSKMYRRGTQKRQYLSLREKILDAFKFKRTVKKEKFWALSDISFDIEPGETVGIIGPNGAGKSTLLKILSKITPPTKGHIVSRGRVASLLEVGTGFHAELTGRENIFLNGSILGMSRNEILKQFDDIVEFSGVQKFLDTPLKRYSSGMQLRLAFAVAAHLDPEILLIDEVLAVGDYEYQKQCLRKMGEISKSGSTLFFVSHDLVAISKLCSKVILLENGKIKKLGSSDDVIKCYINKYNGIELGKKHKVTTNKVISNIALINDNGHNITTIQSGDQLHIKMEFNCRDYTGKLYVGLRFYDKDYQNLLFICSNYYKDVPFNLTNKSESLGIICTIPKIPLNAGNYSIVLKATLNYVILIENYSVDFDVLEGDFYNSGKIPPPNQMFLVDHHWSKEN